MTQAHGGVDREVLRTLQREYEEIVAKLRGRLRGERRERASVTARAEDLKAGLRGARDHVASLELVVSEKNALLAEVTRLARKQRERADAADFVVATYRRAAPAAGDRYQRGATLRTTPLLEPVTGYLANVGRPLRQAAPHHSPVASRAVKRHLQAQLLAAAGLRADPPGV